MSEEPQAGVSAMTAAQPIRIVLADDHAVVRDGTRELLERHDDMIVVGEAEDGEEAVEVVARTEPDVVIMDIAMPKLDGIQATRKIKELSPGVAVLVLTAHDDDQYVFALLEAGAAGYLLKNVRGNQLVDAIRAVQSGESVLHPSVARKVVQRFSQARRPATAEPEHPLSDRELGVLRLAAKGLSNKEIAGRLVISVRTVEVHLANIFHKMDVGSRTEAVIQALRRGWISLDETES